MTTKLTKRQKDVSPVIDLVLNTVSENTQRDYRRALVGFIEWSQAGGHQLTRADVNAYVAHLKATGVPESSINQRLSAIRKLAREAAANGYIDYATEQSICSIKGIAQRGEKLGNWLSKDQCVTMLNSPDTGTLKGLRDRAILAVMIGAGLRRDEVVTLTVEHLQQRDGRWVILNLVGKRNKTRTVPIAAWVKHIIDVWLDASTITSGPLFVAIRRGGHMQSGSMTSQAVWDIVQEHRPIDAGALAPHDLRRTYAKLARKGGAALEQIQLTLGHESLDTTRRYLGSELDLKKAPSDMIELDI